MTTVVEAPSRPPSATYQRRRLWCGITGIGLILVTLWIAAPLGLAGALDQAFANWPPELAGAMAALLLAFGASLLQAGPDIAAYRTEVAFGQRRDGVGILGPYLVHLFQWTGGLVVAGAVVGFSVRLGGEAWWLLTIAGLLVLSFVHVVYPLSPTSRVPAPDSSWWLRVSAELEAMNLPVPNVAWYDHGERSLAGGWNGVGPTRRLFLATSLSEVEPKIAAGLIAREFGHLKLGHRVTTTVATIAWITGGVALTWLLSDHGPAGTVVVLATVMSTWCWLGLLGLWPSLGRRQALQADWFASEKLGADDARRMLDELSRRNLPDETLPTGVAFVFHPIPPMDDRRRHLSLKFR
ncbi:MAG: hypothetical protein AAF561_04340 [Planctomycetota bacterium]